LKQTGSRIQCWGAKKGRKEVFYYYPSPRCTYQHSSETVLENNPHPMKTIVGKSRDKKISDSFFSEVHKFAAFKKVSFVSCSKFEELLETIFEK
jgi:hypothetical protein